MTAMTEELCNLLSQGLEELGLYREKLMPKFSKFFDELALWNPKLGLVEADSEDLVVRHFLDSAAGYQLFRQKLDELRVETEQNALRVADLGTGAGFPGLVLALLAEDDIHFSLDLVEKQQRRCGFLRNVVPLLGLNERVRILQTSYEHLSDRYHILVSRGFRNFNPQQIGLQTSLLLPGGVLFAYKGRRQTIEQEMKEHYSTAKVCRLHVPYLNEERHLVLLP